MASEEPPTDESGAGSTAFDVDLTADEIAIEVHQQADGWTLRVDERGSPERRESEPPTGPPRWLGTVVGRLARGLLFR